MKSDPAAILRDTFGYSSFREGQRETIDAILSGRDVLAVMPTGAGKSLCFQIPALLLEGLTIVISPLISLMKDQVEALNESGIKAAFLNSTLSPGEYAIELEAARSGDTKLIYIAPEGLRRAQSLAENVSIPLVVVDEAHCVSHWGHDFRPGYLDIAYFIASLPERPVTAAFTATATPRVREDIISLLKLRTENLFRTLTGFDRPNLYFETQKPRDRYAALLALLEKRRDKSGIVYCGTRKTVEEIHRLLCLRGFEAARYHAGLSDGERKKSQEDFLFDRKTVIVATNAFGMGIDKSNVSFVIHFTMPRNIESYYQEAGRAGRDGSPADCILLYSGQDVNLNRYLITHGEEGEADPAMVEHNLELLKHMTFYATAKDCLRHRLLSYFGEKSADYCGNCSACRSEYEEADISVPARKIISCVFRLKQRGRLYGKKVITDILKGSAAEKIISSGLDKLSTWGIMKGDDAAFIRTVLDHLVDEKYLAQSDGEYPVIDLLPRAMEFIRSGNPLTMMIRKNLPDFFSAAPALTPRRERTSRDSGWPPASKNAAPAHGGQDLPGEIDEELLGRLKELRRRLAAKEGMPAYIVFSDASLRDMCRKMPQSLSEFAAVSGVGQAKLQKYGSLFVEIIRDYASQ